jgi:hypothetical protein
MMFGKAGNLAVVDLVFMLGLSQYLGVLVPRGTDSWDKGSYQETSMARGREMKEEKVVPKRRTQGMDESPSLP